MEKYEKIEVVGRGAFGVVCLYKEKATKKKVVIKQISVQQMSNEEKEVSLNEAKVLAMLRHPNIIAYYHSFLEEKSLAIVMEYAPGGTLYDYLRQRGRALLPEKEVLSYFGQIVLALEHVHSKQILHRDLKTQNLLLNLRKTIVKVGDFGISKILSSKSKAESLVGTPNNLSPEICVGKPYNQKSDIWALGCVLYELLTLKSPFEGNHVPTVVMKIVRGTFSPVAEHYDQELRRLLERLLQREPSLRPSVRQLLGHPILLPVIYNLYLSIGSLPCVAQKDRPSSALSLTSLEGHSCHSSGSLMTTVSLWHGNSPTPSQLEMPVGYSCIVDVAVGPSDIIGVTASGSTIVWKEVELYKPTALKDKIADPIIQAACGDDFTLLLSERRILLSFGCGRSGSLGHGNRADVESPKIVEALLGHHVVHVACGNSHALVVDKDHNVFAWGDANNGRLGLDFSVLTDLPEQPELPQDLRPKNCFCGPDCSYIVTEAGELWACGNNSNGKLGFSSTELNISRFTAVPKDVFLGAPVVQVASTRKYTAVVTDTSAVFILGAKKNTAVMLNESVLHIASTGEVFVAVTKGGKIIQWKELDPSNSPIEIQPAMQLARNVNVLSLACCGDKIVTVTRNTRSY